MSTYKKQRDLSQESSKYEKDFKAVQLLNEVKDQYAKQVKIMSELKRDVTKSEDLD